MHGTATTGHTSVSFRNEREGVAVGGDVANNDAANDNVVRTADGGATWTLGGRPPISGALFGAVFVPVGTSTVVGVGPKGAAWSADGGLTWQPLDTLGYWSLGFANKEAGWLVGPEGRITKVSF